MPYMGIFGLEFSKAIVIFEFSALKFAENESLTHAVNIGIEVRGPLYKECHISINGFNSKICQFLMMYHKLGILVALLRN